eukprot:1161897-Pelagomonas_calceolata.AAC.11
MQTYLNCCVRSTVCHLPCNDSLWDATHVAACSASHYLPTPYVPEQTQYPAKTQVSNQLLDAALILASSFQLPHTFAHSAFLDAAHVPAAAPACSMKKCKRQNAQGCRTSWTNCSHVQLQLTFSTYQGKLADKVSLVTNNINRTVQSCMYLTCSPWHAELARKVSRSAPSPAGRPQSVCT